MFLQEVGKDGRTGDRLHQLPDHVAGLCEADFKNKLGRFAMVSLVFSVFRAEGVHPPRADPQLEQAIHCALVITRNDRNLHNITQECIDLGSSIQCFQHISLFKMGHTQFPF
ncbi:hypothetical protein D9M69_446650 [compost metagenome]